MLSPLIAKYFWPVAGVIVALCFLSMWLRRRAKSTPQIPAAKPRTAARDSMVARPASRVTTDTAHPPVPPVPVSIAASTFVKSPEVSPAYRSSSESGTSSWEGRRLLDSTGLLPRNSNQMPRILPENVPGVDDSDRVFGTTLNPVLAAMLPESNERRDQARKDLMAAGYYSPHATENLASTRYVLMMLSVVLFGFLTLIAPPQLEAMMVACCAIFPMLCWALPSLYIRNKANQRKHEIEQGMPDLLDMLNMCVSQGLTVPDSLQRIGRDFRAVYPALSQELSIVNDQAKISTLQTALENFSDRIDLPEVHSLTSLLIQTERMGTSISQALTTYSDTMRESQRQQADEKGNRATFRLLFPTVLCLMPAVYLFLLGPAINELQRFFYGGGMDSLNSNSQVVQRMNATRSRGANPASPFQPRRQQ